MAVSERYYELLEFLGDHHIPIDKFAYWLEDRGIPSLPVMIILLLLLGGGVWILLHPSYTIIVYGPDGKPIPGAKVLVDGKTLITNSKGTITIDFKPEYVRVLRDGYFSQFNPKTMSIYLEPIVKKIAIVVQGAEGAAPNGVTIQVSGINGVETFQGTTAEVNVSMVPAKGAVMTYPDKTIKIDVIAPGYIPVSKTVNWTSLKSNEKVNIILHKRQQPRGTIVVETTPPVNGYVFVSQDGIDLGLRGLLQNGTAMIKDVPYGKYTLKIGIQTGKGIYIAPSGKNEANVMVKASKVTVTIPVYVPPKPVKTYITVVDEKTKTPIPGAVIRVKETPIAKTDRRGLAEIVLPEGNTEKVTVDANGYYSKEITIRAGERATVELKRIIKTGTISVKVIDAAGAPVEGAKITLSGESDKQIRSTTNSAGIAEMKVPVGIWTVSVYSPDGYIHVKKSGIVVENNKKTEVTIVLAPTTNITLNTYTTIAGRRIPVSAEIKAIDADSGEELWSGKAGPDGRATADVPKYKAIVFVAETTVDGKPVKTVTRPYYITGSETIQIPVGKYPAHIVAIFDDSWHSFLTIAPDHRYVIYVMVSCYGKSCKIPISASNGVQILGTVPISYARYTRNSDRNGTILLNCAENCTVAVPVQIEASQEAGSCGYIEVASTKIPLGIGVAVPACNEDVCTTTAAPDAIKVGQFAKVSVGVVSPKLYSLQFKESNDFYIQTVEDNICDTWAGKYGIVSAAVGPTRPGAILYAAAMIGESERDIRVPMTVLDGNVHELNIIVSPPIAFKNCNKAVSVTVEGNASEIILHAEGGSLRKDYTIKPGEKVLVPLPSDSNTLTLSAEAFMQYPGHYTLHIFSNVMKITSTTTLTPSANGKRCDFIEVSPDENAFKYIGGIENPRIVVDSIKTEEGPEQNVVDINLSVKEQIISSSTRRIMICVDSAPTPRENTTLTINYHIEGIPGKGTECNVVSDEGTLNISLKGTGDCLTAYWARPREGGTINAKITNNQTAEIMLQNLCYKTSVSGDIQITTDNNSVTATAQETSFQLGPGETKQIDVQISSNFEGNIPAFGTITGTVSYTPESQDTGDYEENNTQTTRTKTISLGNVYVVYPEIEGCFRPKSAYYHNTYGILMVMYKSLDGTCKYVNPTKIAMELMNMEYPLSCTTLSRGHIFVIDCYTRDVPSGVAIPAFADLNRSGIPTTDKNLATYTAIVANFSVKDPQSGIEFEENHILAGPIKVPVRSTELNKMVSLDSNTCTVYNYTPFTSGIEISTAKLMETSQKGITIPPKSHGYPPTNGMSVDLCKGEAAAKVVLKTEIGPIALGECTYKPQPPRTLDINFPTVVNLQTGVRYTPRKDANIAYVYTEQGRVKEYSEYGKPACDLAPCDAKRALAEVYVWASNKILTTDNWKTAERNVLLATNERIDPWNIEANLGPVYILSTEANTPSDINTEDEKTRKLLERYTYTTILENNTKVNIFMDKNIETFIQEYSENNSCDVLELKMFKQQLPTKNGDTETFVFLDANCVEENTIHTFKKWINNNPRVFRGILEALVKTSKDVPSNNTPLEKYPVIGVAYGGIGVRTEKVPYPIKQGGIDSTVYVLGLGRVTPDRITGTDCSQFQIPVWQYSPDISSRAIQGPITLVYSKGYYGIVPTEIWKTIVGT